MDLGNSRLCSTVLSDALALCYYDAYNPKRKRFLEMDGAGCGAANRMRLTAVCIRRKWCKASWPCVNKILTVRLLCVYSRTVFLFISVYCLRRRAMV